MLPHERSLVKRFADKPFALLGVNADAQEQYVESLQKEPIPWRSWRDGDPITGPISSRWNVRNWPTLYLLDAHGIIRSKWLGDPGEKELRDAIKSLLEEIEIP